MSNQYQAPPRKKTIVDYAGLRLTAPAVQGADKRPSLAVIVNRNQVRFDVYTNVPNDKKNGNIRAELDPAAFCFFIEGLEDIIKAPNEKQFVIECKDYTWSGGQRSEKMMVQSKLMVAKDKAGKIFISLQSYDGDRPKIRFFFDIPWKNELLIDRQPATEQQVSEIAARAFVRNLMAMVPITLANSFEEPVKKDKQGGQPQRGGFQQGGYNRNNQQSRNEDDGGSSTSKSSSDEYDWEDDVPM